MSSKRSWCHGPSEPPILLGYYRVFCATSLRASLEREPTAEIITSFIFGSFGVAAMDGALFMPTYRQDNLIYANLSPISDKK
jgi:hypothetical protein